MDPTKHVHPVNKTTDGFFARLHVQGNAVVALSFDLGVVSKLASECLKMIVMIVDTHPRNTNVKPNQANTRPIQKYHADSNTKDHSLDKTKKKAY